ncbi:hypothetical protein [Nitriliruptor alkaliphilus]|uniref:hypothetical protein n=1 Tax=Nitriliruptor alkaliphilus TaxID=427918 RepID=UPI000697B4EA|nr:hypothetical protein [Nitriliruptor alkaliphilus]
MSGAAAEDVPTRARRAAPLTRREKSWVVAAGAGPILLAAVVLLPVALLTSITIGDVLSAAFVYGGLLGLAAAFVATDRLQARQCPRCAERQPRAGEVCTTCGYDLLARPRYACDERHVAYVDDDGDGRCECGRHLQRLPSPRGVGPQVVATLKVGAFLLAFLLAIGVILNVMEGRL